MSTFVTIIYTIAAGAMVLSIFLQAAKGGGLGSALGGKASASVFGGGGASFVSKLTMGFAATFMICAMYLAYAGAHMGPDWGLGAEDSLSARAPAGEDNPERLGPRSQALPTPEEGRAMRAASAL